MRFHHIFWVICYTIVLVNCAPKPSGENTPGDPKDDIDEAHDDAQTTYSPSDLSADVPDNWDQPKDDATSLFLNKSDKNDLEPYPLALSEDVGEAYDGQATSGNFEKPNPKSGTMEHVLMRAEYYGEPPSMGRQPARRKRDEQSFRSTLSEGNSRFNKRGTKYSAVNRMKRETGMRSEDILALLSLWDAQQRRNKEGGYYHQAPYYNQMDPYEDPADNLNSEDKWLDEPIISPSHFSNGYDNFYDKPSHYKYPQSYADFMPEQNGYLQRVDALRRKRPWAGFGTGKSHQVKRFMVAKKRSEPNQYYYTQKSYKPRDDLYSLDELLKSSQNMREQGLPVSRRMIL